MLFTISKLKKKPNRILALFSSLVLSAALEKYPISFSIIGLRLRKKIEAFSIFLKGFDFESF